MIFHRYISLPEGNSFFTSHFSRESPWPISTLARRSGVLHGWSILALAVLRALDGRLVVDPTERQADARTNWMGRRWGVHRVFKGHLRGVQWKMTAVCLLNGMLQVSYLTSSMGF